MRSAIFHNGATGRRNNSFCGDLITRRCVPTLSPTPGPLHPDQPGGIIHADRSLQEARQRIRVTWCRFTLYTVANLRCTLRSIHVVNCGQFTLYADVNSRCTPWPIHVVHCGQFTLYRHTAVNSRCIYTTSNCTLRLIRVVPYGQFPLYTAANSCCKLRSIHVVH